MYKTSAREPNGCAPDYLKKDRKLEGYKLKKLLQQGVLKNSRWEDKLDLDEIIQHKPTDLKNNIIDQIGVQVKKEEFYDRLADVQAFYRKGIYCA
jgi:hypothetical protein